MFFSPAAARHASPVGDIPATLLVGTLAFTTSFVGVDYLATVATNYDNLPALLSSQLNAFWDGSASLLKQPIYRWSSTLSTITLTASCIASTVAFVGGYYFYLADAPLLITHIKGRQLLTGKAAIKKWLKKQKKAEEYGGVGIPLITTPEGVELGLSDRDETDHCLLIAGTGGGKTTVLFPRIEAAIRRGDQVLLFDNKSDFTASLSSAKNVILVAPWDARGWAWDVAADIQNRSDAEAFAAALILSSGDNPMWANAARNILTAIIIRAQREHPGKWTFQFITDVFSAGAPEIKATVEKYTPEYSVSVEDMTGKTAQSVLLNLVSFLSPVFTLADAWARCPVKGRFSIKRWLHNKGEEANKTLLIQGNGAHEELQKSITQSIISSIKREVTSPRVSESTTRHVSIFLDEFPQLGKLEGFDNLVVVGRSKGVRLTIAIQDVSQLKEIYGNNITQTWLSNFSTLIVGKLGGADTTKYLSDLVGKRKIRRYQPSFSNDGQNMPSRTDQYVEEEVTVIRQEEWTTELGFQGDSMRMCVLTGDEYAYFFDAATLGNEMKRIKRKAHVPARWTASDWPSAIDVAIAEAGGRLK
ncbi:MAG: type IV secretion system DNA-binding domain-containing protein [Methylomarinum sp.]|nr:type IV secretion system DNA-binding domain-containing protein [Methylomarinum sp.]